MYVHAYVLIRIDVSVHTLWTSCDYTFPRVKIMRLITACSNPSPLSHLCLKTMNKATLQRFVFYVYNICSSSCNVFHQNTTTAITFIPTTATANAIAITTVTATSLLLLPLRTTTPPTPPTTPTTLTPPTLTHTHTRIYTITTTYNYHLPLPLSLVPRKCHSLQRRLRY